MKKISVLFLVMFLCCFNGVTYADLDDGLVAYYPFDGNANDVSGNGNDATEKGPTLTEDRFGNADGAFSFDGVNDNISIPDNGSLNLEDLTLSGWVYVDNATNTGNMRIISRDNNAEPGVARDAFVLTSSAGYCADGHPSFTIMIDGAHNSICATESLASGWHLIVGTRSNSTMRLYVDGIKHATLDNTVIGKLNINITSHIGSFGTEWAGYYEYFNGKIDDVRIYNRALSDSEIQALYNETPCDCPTCPITDDRYDEGKQAGIEYCKNNPYACGIDVSGDYDNGYKDGKDFCKNNPSKCDITCTSLGCSNGGGDSDDNCATFNFFENSLHIPCFDAGTANYWIDLEFVNGDPVTFELKNAGPND